MDNLIRENSELKNASSDLKNKLKETIALYDITKQICKSLEENEIYNSFYNEIKKNMPVEECRFIKGNINLSEYSGFRIFPLKINDQEFGHLLVKGIKDEDENKFNILSQQFLLGIKRSVLYQKVQELAITDGLTGAFSRRYWIERFQEELSRSKKFQYNLSFLMIDIDHFKNFNDCYGHLVGDAILKSTAETIKENLRQIDLIGRYGGEEFSVILTETNKEKAKLAAERIREAIEKKPIKVYDENLKITISIGISTFPDDAKDTINLIEIADRALYQAKENGRNRVHS